MMKQVVRKLPVFSRFTNLLHCFSEQKQIEQQFQKHYQRNDPIKGYCTAQGSKQFSLINKTIHSDYWKTPLYIKQQLHLSSLGLGTQNGQPTYQHDIKQFQTLIYNLENGYINVLDTDVNFRYGKSEKTINASLNYLIKQKSFKRENFFIATKCGYIMQDIDSQLDQKKMLQIILDEKYAEKQDFVNQIYCLSQGFIQFSLAKSLLSLGLETIDLFYLNNPIQALLAVIKKQQLLKRLANAFQIMEELRADQKIRYYGIASFVAFRSPSTEDEVHGCLTQIAELARKIGGQNHGLRFCLIPLNLGMPEALLKWQKNREKNKDVNIFQSARQNEINVNICCPLFQGRLAKVPFQSTLLNNFSNNCAKHLQLIRSVSQNNLISTIVGSSSKEHSIQDLEVAKNRHLTAQEWNKILPMPE